MLTLNRALPASARLARCLSTTAVRANESAGTYYERRQPSRDNRDRAPRKPMNTDEQRQQRLATVKRVLEHRAMTPAPHLLTLADLSPAQIETIVHNALALKVCVKQFGTASVRKSLSDRSVALMFSKRSTRTRVASETSVTTLGGNAMFLGSGDIQLGVNESLRDTATVVGSMVDGIMARVNGHEEVETLAKYSPVPVINALSDLYHPTQILADLLTLIEVYSSGDVRLPDVVADAPGPMGTKARRWAQDHFAFDKLLKGKKLAWVGDTNNMTNEFLVVMPRLGMEVSVAAPKGYDKVDPRVWARVTEAGTESLISFTNSPAEALKDADIVVTDTWISMGQEEEAASRLSAFAGYQLTNKLINESGAKPDWKFMHCLPRHQEEVDDEVFYGPRSVVFPEAENRKWTIMAVFDAFMGRWTHA